MHKEGRQIQTGEMTATGESSEDLKLCYAPFALAPPREGAVPTFQLGRAAKHQNGQLAQLKEYRGQLHLRSSQQRCNVELEDKAPCFHRKHLVPEHRKKGPQKLRQHHRVHEENAPPQRCQLRRTHDRNKENVGGQRLLWLAQRG